MTYNPPAIVAMDGPMRTEVKKTAEGIVLPGISHMSARRPSPVAKGAEPNTPPKKRITRRVSIL
jgi:hypothetical protein